MIETIKQLVEAWGPSGFEHHVRALIREMVVPYADAIETDGLGNLICRVGSGGKKVMVAAHMDEIGVMPIFREPKSGYLRFTSIGGLIQTTLLGSRVRFEHGAVGVIGAHDYFHAGRTTLTDLDQFFIDTSDGSGAESVTAGMPGAFWRPLEVQGTRLIAKSMDDRIGCAIAVEAMRRLNKQTANTVYFVFTVQEEVGIRGARPAAYGIAPDIGIALDVTSTGDMIRNEKMDVALGAGTAIKIADSNHIVPPQIRDWMVARAEADGIMFQRELLTLGSTDASGIQITRAGVPSGVISIPCRYVHTQSEMVDSRDVEASVALLTGLLTHPITL
ncbi:MAG: M20/M25/M40 family metallo-hydrolase [Chloroflexota bacterium]|nr:M20/M25/M40 family metallo-hydrolase [Chloroflexota bacterium]